MGLTKNRDFIIVGVRGSGKSTIADYLTQKYLYKDVALADVVREACTFFELEPTRDNLVLIGTEIARKQIDEKIWIKKTQRKINMYRQMLNSYPTETPIVVSDVRFHNEYEHFLKQNFFPIRVVTSGDMNIERAKKRDGSINEELLQHETETNWKDFVGYTIYNNSTLENLYVQIDRLMELLQDDQFFKSQMDFVKVSYFGKR